MSARTSFGSVNTDGWMLCAWFTISWLLISGCVSRHPETAPTPAATNDRLFEVLMDGKYGYIDGDGDVVIPPRFENAFVFSEGLALVSVDGLWGYVDASGEFVIKPRFWNADFFHEGRASFTSEETRKKGFIDRSGAVVIAPVYDEVEPFRDGVARVAVYTISKEELDRLTAQMPWDDDEAMDQAQAEFVARYVDYQFIDRFGHALTNYHPRLDRRDGVGEEDGMVRVYDPKGLVGYADRGTIVIEPRFKEGDEFSEGLAGVQINGMWGFINRAGDIVIPPKWLWVEQFSGGLAGVRSASGFGYIDKQGRYVWEPTK